MLTLDQLLRYSQAVGRLFWWYKEIYPPLPHHLEKDLSLISTYSLQLLITVNIGLHRSSEEIHSRMLGVLCSVFDCERSYK